MPQAVIEVQVSLKVLKSRLKRNEALYFYASIVCFDNIETKTASLLPGFGHPGGYDWSHHPKSTQNDGGSIAVNGMGKHEFVQNENK